MKKTIIPGVAAAIFLLGGCGGGSASDAPQAGESTTAQSSSSSTAEPSLEALARESQDAQGFARAALATLRPQVIDRYVPRVFRSAALRSQALSVDSLMQNEQIRAALVRYYDKVQAAGARALESSDLSALLEAVYNAIRDYILAWLEELFGVGDDTNGTAGSQSSSSETNQTQALQDTNASFSYDLIGGQTFYVVSTKTDMTVDVSEDGRSGSGSVGVISMDFTDSVASDGTLTLLSELMGRWNLHMRYLDPGYCIAADAVDEDGARYPSYWFYNESDREAADTVDDAKALCYLHAAAGQIPDDGPKIDEGDVTPIDDIRSGHSPVEGNDAKTVYENLRALDHGSVSYDDAEYFTRSMRAGPLWLYGTNGRTDDFFSQESGRIVRELMPKALSSATAIQTLLGDGYAMALDFETETAADLNASLNHFAARMQAIAKSASIAMDKAGKSAKFYGSDTTSYGDKVEFAAGNLGLDVCLVFFMCDTAVEGDAYLQITNDGTDGNYADIGFKTHFTATSTKIDAIAFNRVVSDRNTNTIRADGYSLNLTGFLFERSGGTLDLQGSGTLTAQNRQTHAAVDDFDVRVFINEDQALSFSTRAMSAKLHGSVETASGKHFEGALRFNAFDPQNNEFNGTLSASENDPALSGVFRASLTYDDARRWINGESAVTAAPGLPYLENADGTLEPVASLVDFNGLEARSFAHPDVRLACSKNQNGDYICKKRFSRLSKTLRFVPDGSLMQIETGSGRFYVIGIQALHDYAPSKLVLLNADDESSVVTIDADRYGDADVRRIDIVGHSLENTPVNIDTVGNRSYGLDLTLSRGDIELSADMLMKKNGTLWEYYVRDLVAKDANGSLEARRIYVSQEGSNRLLPALDTLAAKALGMDLNFGTMASPSWSLLKPYRQIELEGFKMRIQGKEATASLESEMHFANDKSSIVSQSQTLYTYGAASVSADADAVAVSQSDGTYATDYNATGTIQATGHPDYRFMIESVPSEMFLTLEREDTGYQTGFRVQGTSASGYDSYGVVSDFSMDATFNNLERMHVKNADGIMGTYNRQNDAYRIFYENGDIEYLFVN